MRKFLRFIAKVLGVLAATLLLTSCVLRWQAYQFDRRATAVMGQMKRIRLRQTSSQEAISLLTPLGFRRDTSEHPKGDEQVYSLTVSRVPGSAWSAWEMTVAELLLRWRVMRDLVFWMGLRFWLFHAEVTVDNDRAVAMAYRLTVLHRLDVFVSLSVQSLESKEMAHWSGQEEQQQFMAYYRPQFGDQAMDIKFSAEAPRDQVETAFRPRLACVWKLRECDRAADLLPEVRLSQ
jgi:hypothetical protein